MPEYWDKSVAQAPSRLPIFTEDQREQIRNCFTEELQESLCEYLIEIAHLEQFDPDGSKRAPFDETTLRVVDIPKDASESDLRTLFEAFGQITRINVFGPGCGAAFVNFAHRADAVAACQQLDGCGRGHTIMSVKFVELLKEEMAEVTATYATIVVTTSWPLEDEWKMELEREKKAALGSPLSARVFLAYDACEPPGPEQFGGDNIRCRHHLPPLKSK
ncbi:eukaryotic translation initiation factor 3 subunit G [Apiospora kogelbergensis]|uniref:Eukaryotic translation initiation factor 3 subunit G n=1 Tax=Apiospora kogelbergensis TaxID=1337665 RepID=A0AAW0Q975_9PEZI